ncbi:sugar transferase [Geodermatophilus nigrescens]|uniref:Exopolysaccharide biosynthesis polyprenyl glycosylphosphotransferase n=1 Tax=Geodermatophilus nigrescens TaxID=1070870 RepID=A0A1M5E3U6_9ACTN|nr:sugar transferase [Geodermatophilus nigrescens]SHF73917.1 exopolysaccharide biosynthesis polyprenyl glycosylphosphotransferase [Geodermatophilus nigrescens]
MLHDSREQDRSGAAGAGLRIHADRVRRQEQDDSGGRRPAPGWLRRYRRATVVSDVLAAALAGATAQVLRFGTEVVPSTTLLVTGVFPVVWVAVVMLAGGHRAAHLGTGTEEYRAVIRAGVGCLALIAVVSYAFALQLSRGLVVVALPGAVVLSAVGRHVLRRVVHRLRAGGRCLRTVVAVGRSNAVADLVRQLDHDSHCGMAVVAACVPDRSPTGALVDTGVPVEGDLRSAAEVARRLDVDAVAVTSSSETAAVYLRRLSWELEGSGIELLVAPGLMEVAGPRMHVRPFIGLPLVHVEEPVFTGPKRLVKELIDRSGAAVALVLVLPVLLAAAVAIRLDSPGPVLFRQVRVGRDGRTFPMLKFRTMVADAEQRRGELADRNRCGDGPMFKVADDPRITRVGRVLRRHSIDELPQFVDVLLGHMSLVGPRPPLPDEVALYDDSVARRLLVKPGLTGLWQVSGRSDLSWDEAVRLDLRYVENWSLALDLQIIWKTFRAVARPLGAY